MAESLVTGHWVGQVSVNVVAWKRPRNLCGPAGSGDSSDKSGNEGQHWRSSLARKVSRSGMEVAGEVAYDGDGVGSLAWW